MNNIGYLSCEDVYLYYLDSDKGFTARAVKRAKNLMRSIVLLHTFILYGNSINIANDKITYDIHDRSLNVAVNDKLVFTYKYDERSGLFFNEIKNRERILKNKMLLIKNIEFTDINRDGYKDLKFSTTLIDNYKIIMLYDYVNKTFRPLYIKEKNSLTKLKEFKGGMERNSFLRIDNDGDIFPNKESLYKFSTDNELVLLQTIEYDVEYFDNPYIKVTKYDDKEIFLTCKYVTGIFNSEKDTENCLDVLSKQNLVNYNNIAYYLQKAGANEEAIFLLEKILEKFPNRTVAYYNLGDAYWAMDEREKAVKAYLKYIEQMRRKGLEKKIPKHILEKVGMTPKN